MKKTMLAACAVVAMIVGFLTSGCCSSLPTTNPTMEPAITTEEKPDAETERAEKLKAAFDLHKRITSVTTMTSLVYAQSPEMINLEPEAAADAAIKHVAEGIKMLSDVEQEISALKFLPEDPDGYVAEIKRVQAIADGREERMRQALIQIIRTNRNTESKESTP